MKPIFWNQSLVDQMCRNAVLYGENSGCLWAVRQIGQLLTSQLYGFGITKDMSNYLEATDLVDGLVTEFKHLVFMVESKDDYMREYVALHPTDEAQKNKQQYYAEHKKFLGVKIELDDAKRQLLTFVREKEALEKQVKSLTYYVAEQDDTICALQQRLDDLSFNREIK